MQLCDYKTKAQTSVDTFGCLYLGKIIDVLINMLILSGVETLADIFLFPVKAQIASNKETIWFKCGRGVQ